MRVIKIIWYRYIRNELICNCGCRESSFSADYRHPSIYCDNCKTKLD